MGNEMGKKEKRKGKEHRGFENPAAVYGSKEEKMIVFRRVRDEIERWLEETF